MSVINMWINRYILAGRGSVADTAPTNEVVVDANGAMATSITSSALTNAQALPTKLVHSDGGLTTRYITGNAQDAGALVGAAAHLMGYTGSAANFEPWRNNTEGTLLASTARTATPPNSDQTNHNATGIAVTIDVTAIVSTPSIVVAIEVKDVASGKYVPVLTSAAITAVGTIRLRVAPSLAVAANLVANDIVGRTWRVTVTHANANSITYSVGYQLNV